jgi:hypothetical protein
LQSRPSPTANTHIPLNNVVRKLSLEAADNDLIAPHLGNGIKAAKGIKSARVQNRVILAALIDGNLRHSEAAMLAFTKVT